MSEIIYKDNNIEFSADDIYIGKDNNGLLCFFIDTSKYFDIRYATFNKGCTYFNYKTKHEVKNIFKSYSRIADITSANADNEFVYLFCPEIVYNRIMTNKAAYGAGKYNTKHKPKCFIKIKRK